MLISPGKGTRGNREGQSLHHQSNQPSTGSNPSSDSDSDSGLNSQPPRLRHGSDWQTKERIHYFSFNCFFHTFENLSARPDASSCPPVPDLWVFACSGHIFHNQQLFTRNSIMTFNNRQLGSRKKAFNSKRWKIACDARWRQKNP